MSTLPLTNNRISRLSCVFRPNSMPRPSKRISTPLLSAVHSIGGQPVSRISYLSCCVTMFLNVTSRVTAIQLEAEPGNTLSVYPNPLSVSRELKDGGQH